VALSLGTIFGMVIWDLVFEVRPGLVPRDLEAAQAYYRGLHTAKLPMALVLPLAAVIIIGHFGMKSWNDGGLVNWAPFAALIAVLAIEVVVALPKERELWKMPAASSADAATQEKMRAHVRAARNTHLAIAAVLAWLACTL
jgi:hypothetical protein